MNMNANLPQHPCANKCTDFKGEQCKSCLVQELPSSKECDSEFLLGDVVVLTKLCRNFYSNDLFEVKGKATEQLWSVRSKNHLIIVASKEIRPATTAEIQANRRLTEAEQAIAEVS
nr:hypothetical protein [Acinetobacter guillouiae]